MNKPKIFALTATLVVLTALAIAATAYAQTLSTPTISPPTGVYGQVPQTGSPVTGFNGGYGCGGFGCPWLNGNTVGSQNGNAALPRVGMRGR